MTLCTASEANLPTTKARTNMTAAHLLARSLTGTHTKELPGSTRMSAKLSLTLRLRRPKASSYLARAAAVRRELLRKPPPTCGRLWPGAPQAGTSHRTQRLISTCSGQSHLRYLLALAVYHFDPIDALPIPRHPVDLLNELQQYQSVDLGCRA